jgi:hypothetical protein
MSYQLPVTVTFSLNVMSISAESATLVAPSTGDVLATVGGTSTTPHKFVGDAVLRGLGAPVAKSLPFWSVSVQPLSARRAAVVLVKAGVAALPSKQLALP